MIKADTYYGHFFTLFTGKNWKDNFWRKVQENSEANFFLDEVPNAVGSDELNLLADKVSENKYLWAACQSHLPPSKIALKGELNNFTIC
jgi:hypothetical protein